MKLGLVLGAGGVQGAAWLAGALAALRDEAGFELGASERIVGTSAGSLLATGIAAGLEPEQVIALAPAGDARRVDPEPASSWPGSPALALASLLRPLSLRPGAALAGWLPRGIASTVSLQETIARVAPLEWGHHEGLRIVACDYRTGRRVSFGDPEAPSAGLPAAVAASCAIPGVFEPVEIGGRPYVDGGVHSLSNLDLLAGEGLDLVICLNPTSAGASVASVRPTDWMLNGIRGASAWSVRSEAARVRASGTEVFLLEPTREDLDQMGIDLMSPIGRGYTALVARRTTAAQLQARRLPVFS